MLSVRRVLFVIHNSVIIHKKYEQGVKNHGRTIKKEYARLDRFHRLNGRGFITRWFDRRNRLVGEKREIAGDAH